MKPRILLSLNKSHNYNLLTAVNSPQIFHLLKLLNEYHKRRNLEKRKVNYRRAVDALGTCIDAVPTVHECSAREYEKRECTDCR